MAETITTITKDGVTARVSSAGAQLMGIERDGLEYLWQGDERWWPRRAPVLFPIVGSLRNDLVMTGNGPAPMKQHGVARNFEHRLVEATEGSVTYELAANDDTLALYPYDFVLSMSYRLLEGGVLEQRFVVKNAGDDPMPFCVGGHPAFNVPVDPASGETFEDYELVFSEPWTYSTPTLNDDHLLQWDVLTPVVKDAAVKPVERSMFDIDTVVLKDVPNNTITLRGTKSGHGVKVDFAGFDYCGVWSAAGNAPFIALEPWTGVATGTDEGDDFADKRGVVFLQPSEVFERAFTITVF